MTDQPVVTELHTAKPTPKLSAMLLKLVFLVAAWYLIYRNLLPAADWLTEHVLGLSLRTHLGSSVGFFIYEVPKVLMLLVLIVFGIGVLRTFFTPERTRSMLVGRREFIGNVLAAVLGIPTPFCSCSAVPLFLGFVEAGVPIGVTLSFLIAAPMVNEVALVLLFGIFGWKVAVMYVSMGLLIAITAGWIIGRFHPERHIEEWVLEVRTGASQADSSSPEWWERIDSGKQAVRDIVGRVWIYVVLGIAVGAGIHGYVPTGMMASFMGKGVWWSVPAAVLAGVPMYSNAAGIIPVVQALLEKGASLGTALAFMMSVIGVSTPEVVILRKVLKPRLIAMFVGTMAIGIVTVGYLFNAIF